jgi:hypothetical protein
MARQWLAVAFIVATAGWGGCSSSSSSSSSSGAGNDMDKMAAALDQPSANQASTASASQPASPDANVSANGAAQPAAVANNAAPAADPSLASKRGFDLDDWNEASFVLVKGDAAKTAEILAGAWKGKVVKDVLGKPVQDNAIQIVVFQLAGHPWTVFACDGSQLELVTKALSRDTDVLVAWQSDFNGWSGVELYRGGEEVEAVHWGPDEDKLGDDADAAKWQTRAEIVRKNEDESYNDAFLFRSKARKVTAQDLQKGDAFIDDMFRAHDAYLPDSLQMPWATTEDADKISSPLGPAAFASVHMVEISDR